MTTHMPKTIRAIVDQDALARVSSFFDAGLEDIFNELFQNARRAGATRVDVTHEDGQITVTDDGSGIEDPQSLLSFGRSEWNNPDISAEHPAGMGFYSLSRRDSVIVQSHPSNGTPWQVTLEPDHFTGKADAEVIDLIDEAPRPHGTGVAFDWEKDSHWSVRASSMYFPLAVTLNGEAIQQTDFFKDATSIHEWEGLRIGVYRNNTHSWGDQYGSVNFHGVVVRAADHLPYVPTLDSGRYGVKIDVVACPHLELTLPARKKLVQTPFLERLNDASLRAIYTDIVVTGLDIGVSKQVQLDAARLGIHINDAQPMLRHWVPSSDWYMTDDSAANIKHQVLDGAFIMDSDIGKPFEHTIRRAIDHSDLPIDIFQQDSDLIGHAWYDRIPIISDIRVIASFGENQYDLISDDVKAHGFRPDTIDVEILAKDPNGKEIVMLATTDIALVDDTHEDAFNAHPYVTVNSDVTVDDLVNLVMSAHFCAYDEGDSYDTQESEATEEVRTMAITIIKSKDEAFKQDLLNSLQRMGVHRLSSGTSIVITVGDDRTISVDINMPETNTDQ